jgi:Bacterial Ig-like domain (group 1)
MKRPPAGVSTLSTLRVALAFAVCTFAMASCSSDAAATPAAIAIVSGNNQVGTIGMELPATLVVKVTDESGAGVPGVQVTFAASNGATLRSGAAITNSSGMASDSVTALGTLVGAQTVTATIAGVSSFATFTLSAMGRAIR